MATADQIQLLYITYFGRPADPAGLTYWTTGNQASLSQDQAADFFAADREFVQTTAGKSTQEIINQFYLNLFGRPADAGGLAFYTAEVLNGITSIQDVGLKIALGADPTDKAVLDKKGLAANQWTALVRNDASAATKYTLNNSLSFTYGVDYLAGVTTTIPSVPVTQAIIDGLPPNGTVGLIKNDAPVGGITEGTGVTFTITTIPELIGKQIAYQLTGVELADLVPGQTLAGTLTVGATGKAVLNVSLAKDASIETGEILSIIFPGNSVFAKPPGSASVPIVDTTVPTASAILTTNQDISGLNIAAPVSGNFTYFANEDTLGQSDQLFLSPGATAAVTLNVGTQGNFNLRNFSTDGIQTLELRPSDETLANTGRVDLQAALGLTSINVSQSQLGALDFRDIQSAAGFSTSIVDSFSTFNYNFDVNALLGANAVEVFVSETPIDATTGEAVGFDFTQGPTNADASIEILDFISEGSITNVVDQLSVGDALDVIQFFGDASLNITTDLGLAPNGNRRIRGLDATGLSRDLTLSYTSILGDVLNDLIADVTVIGAAGNNLLTLGTQSPFLPTDFKVTTFAGNDSVTTVGGDDEINAGEGNNSVAAGDGQNTVTTGAGNDAVSSGVGADLINAGAGSNTISSGDGNDTVTTLGGDDFIFAGQGNDSVEAGNGNNQVFGDDFGDGAGNDTIRTGSGGDFIVADAFVGGQVEGAGNDSVVSGAGNDSVYAGSGSNTVESGEGDDLVVLGTTAAGGPIARTPQADTFANSVSLGVGNDRLRIDTDSLTNLDSINGGEGIDTVELFNGGVLLASETLRTSRIEALDLRGFGSYNVTLTNELVRTSDEFVNGSRRFSVLTSSGDLVSDPAGNVTLDLSSLTPVDAQGNLLSILYEGQNDTDLEQVIIRDGLISDQTILDFGEAFADADETFADILRIVDSADVTKDDLIFVSGLEVVELTSTVNGPQSFTFDLRNLTLAQFNALVGDTTDVLIIRATPSLAGSVSTLSIDLRGADPGISGRIQIEQSASLNVSVQADPGFLVPISTALFYTPNPDNLQGNGADNLFTAYQLADVQTADLANGQGGTDTLDLRFAVSNPAATLAAQLQNTNISNIEIFKFNPAAVNQAVQFDGIGAGFAVGLASVITSTGNDRVVGIERSLFIDTGFGNDTVGVLDGANGTVFTGEGNDSVTTGNGNDFINAGEGENTVNAGDGGNVVLSGAGTDLITSGTGSDLILAGAGNNTVSAGDGNNTVNTLEGDDSIATGTGFDIINAGDGNNTVRSGAAADFVVTGVGNDSIFTASANGQVDNDTVDSGSGSDSILVGLGDDSVQAGEGDDFIFLSATSGTLISPPGELFADEAGGLTAGDRINGGGGFDLVALESLFDITLSGVQLQEIEAVNIFVDANDVDVVVSSDLFPGNGSVVDGQSVLQLSYAGNLPTQVNGSVDASSLVQGEAIDLTIGCIDDFTALGGAGNDRFATVSDNFFPVGDITVQGNGGSDTIDLTARATATAATISFATGNDGGNGGTGTGGDIITGYRLANDSIRVTGGLLTDIGSIIDGPLGFGRLQVTNAQLTLGGLADTTGFLQGTASGRNILNLTGPARSLTDAQLLDAGAIAANINNVGVVGNGLALGDGFGIALTVTNVTNQALIFQQGQTKTALYLYVESSFDFDANKAYTVEAGELRQLGVFDTNLLTGSELVV